MAINPSMVGFVSNRSSRVQQWSVVRPAATVDCWMSWFSWAICVRWRQEIFVGYLLDCWDAFVRICFGQFVGYLLNKNIRILWTGNANLTQQNCAEAFAQAQQGSVGSARLAAIIKPIGTINWLPSLETNSQTIPTGFPTGNWSSNSYLGGAMLVVTGSVIVEAYCGGPLCLVLGHALCGATTGSSWLRQGDDNQEHQPHRWRWMMESCAWFPSPIGKSSKITTGTGAEHTPRLLDNTACFSLPVTLTTKYRSAFFDNRWFFWHTPDNIMFRDFEYLFLFYPGKMPSKWFSVVFFLRCDWPPSNHGFELLGWSNSHHSNNSRARWSVLQPVMNIRINQQWSLRSGLETVHLIDCRSFSLVDPFAQRSLTTGLASNYWLLAITHHS